LEVVLDAEVAPQAAKETVAAPIARAFVTYPFSGRVCFDFMTLLRSRRVLWFNFYLFDLVSGPCRCGGVNSPPVPNIGKDI
jgi:hypothetical protein